MRLRVAALRFRPFCGDGFEVALLPDTAPGSSVRSAISASSMAVFRRSSIAMIDANPSVIQSHLSEPE